MKNAVFGRLIALVNMLPKRCLFMLAVIFLAVGCQEKTPEQYIEEAKQFAESGNSQAAIVSLKNAVQKAPRSAQARYELGKVYLSVQDFASAEKELSRALELGSEGDEILVMLAKAMQRSGSNVALVDLEYDGERLTSAEQLEIGYRRLASLVQLRKQEEAEALVFDLKKLESNTVYKELVDSYGYVLREDISSAIASAEAAYARAPLNTDVLSLNARLYKVNNQLDKAIEVYDEYVKVAPRDAESKFELARLLVDSRQPERAEKYIDELLAVAENNGYLNQLKAVVRASAKDFKSAKQYAETAIGNGRAEETTRLIAGLSSYQLEDYDSAVAHLSLIASSLPDDHPGLRILAASLLKSNNGEEAGSVLSRVQAIEGEDASLFSRAGYEMIKSGNTEAAKKIVEQADKISQSSKDLARLGVLKLSLNDLEGLVDLESAVAKEPSDVQTKATLASAYLSTKQLDKAMKLAKDWQQESPDTVEGYLLEAEVLKRNDKIAEASVVINKALEIDPKNIAAQLADVTVDVRNKSLREAERKLEDILAVAPTNQNALASLFAVKNELGEGEEAFEFIGNVARDNPSDKNLAVLFSRLAIYFGKNEEAVEMLETIPADRKAPSSFWQTKGVALIRSNKTGQALNHYATWSELFPNKEVATLGRLLLLDSRRAYSDAAEVSRKFLARKHSDQIAILHSYFLVVSGDLVGGKEKYEALDDKLKALPLVRGIRARILVLEGKAALALDDAQASYKQNPSTDNMIVLMRSVDAAKGRPETLEVLKSHAEQYPEDVRTQVLLGERLIEVDRKAAVNIYENIIEKTPQNFLVLNNLAYLEMEDGNLDKASSYGARAYEIQPTNAFVADTYAQILIKQNNLEEAVRIYNSVMNKPVNSDEISLNFVEALLMNDSKTIAKRRMDELNLTTERGRARLAELKRKYL